MKVVLYVLGAVVLLALGAAGAWLMKPAPKPAPAQLLVRLGSLDLEPHPFPGRAIHAGSIYVPSALKSAYSPSDVFENPEKVETVIGQVFGHGDYRDELNAQVKATTFLKFFGIAAATSSSLISVVHTTVDGMLIEDMRLDQFADARLRTDFAAKLDSLRLLVALQSVAKAKSMKVNFKQSDGSTLSAGRDELAKLLAERSGSTTSDETYADFAFASRPAFRIGGEDSAMTPESAAELAAKLKDAGINSKVKGNTCWGELSWFQVELVEELAGTIVTARATESRLSGQIATLTGQVASLDGERRQLASARDELLGKARELNSALLQRDQALVLRDATLAEQALARQQLEDKFLAQLAMAQQLQASGDQDKARVRDLQAEVAGLRKALDDTKKLTAKLSDRLRANPRLEEEFRLTTEIQRKVSEKP